MNERINLAELTKPIFVQQHPYGELVGIYRRRATGLLDALRSGIGKGGENISERYLVSEALLFYRRASSFEQLNLSRQRD